MREQQGIALTGHPFTRYIEVGPGLMTIEPGMRVELPDEATEERDVDSAQTSDDGDVQRDTLPGGHVAATLHMGSYETLPDAYAALEVWIESEGLTTTGAPWESYLTSPTDYPDPKDWKTEVCWPVE